MNTVLFKLGELGQWGSGGTPLASRRDYYDGDIPWLVIEDLTDGVVRRARKTITRVGLENSAAKIVPPGTLLIAMYGSIGKLGITGISCATNQAIAFCQPNPAKVNLKFLFYWLLNERRNFVHAGRGGTQQNISQELLKDYDIRLPSLPEQERVAPLLEQANRLRRTRCYALELSDAFVPAAFLEIFGDPLGNPRRYERVRVEDLFANDRDGVKCGPFGTALKKHEYTATGVPVWTMENVQANEFKEHGSLFTTETKFQELSAYRVRNDDILISRAGTVGRMAIVRTRYEKSILHTNLIRLSLNRDRVLAVYFVVLMTWFAARVARLKTGQEDAYTFMNTGALGELRIPLPPIQEQRKFGTLVKEHEQLRAGQREALRQAEHLFESLLDRAFAG